jgi:ribosome maturation factor RimP
VQPRDDELVELLGPAVEALGYELADLEVHLGGPHGVLRLFIDGDAGITLEDCETVSRQISSVLDVADPIASDYRLEVSSPGLNRRLSKQEHYDRYAGSLIKVRLKRLVQGRRRLKGLLLSRDSETVVLRIGDKDISIPLDEIDTARLVPDL